MSKGKTRLDQFENNWYKPGGNAVSRVIWYFLNVFVMKNGWVPLSGLKVFLLRMFGANIGKGVVIKPVVNVKYPWKLTIGDHCWIGENVWIDNLEQVTIGSHVCISQGALILSGNHNYTKETFDLMVKPITIEDGAWIGAKTIVTQGVKIGSHALLTVGSVASSSLESYAIYRGNPAVKVKDRTITSKSS